MAAVQVWSWDVDTTTFQYTADVTLFTVYVPWLEIQLLEQRNNHHPSTRSLERALCYVREVFIIHVGGTRCVTSSTDNIMKILARITLTVEFIRTCIFIFLFYV